MEVGKGGRRCRWRRDHWFLLRCLVQARRGSGCCKEIGANSRTVRSFQTDEIDLPADQLFRPLRLSQKQAGAGHGHAVGRESSRSRMHVSLEMMEQSNIARRPFLPETQIRQTSFTSLPHCFDRLFTQPLLPTRVLICEY